MKANAKAKAKAKIRVKIRIHIHDEGFYCIHTAESYGSSTLSRD